MRPPCQWCGKPADTVVIRPVDGQLPSMSCVNGDVVAVYLCRKHDVSARVLVIQDAVRAETGMDRLDVIVSDVEEPAA